MNTKSTIQNAVVRLLEPVNEITLAFLFGSVLKRDSFRDVDIAVQLVRSFPRTEYLNFQLDLQLRLQKVLKNEVDLIILNQAPPLLRYKVLKTGTLIIEKDRAAFRDFFKRTIYEYFDFLPVFNLYREKMRRRTAGKDGRL
ncbi:MAG: nucleotidyltransferase domain-containing protein [Pseudomonadota bacterium]